MSRIEQIWERFGTMPSEFHTVTGLPFTYAVPTQYLRVTRHGREIDRSLSRTNFAYALEMMPEDSPGALKGRQGASYTWAILMDRRIRQGDW